MPAKDGAVEFSSIVHAWKHRGYLRQYANQRCRLLLNVKLIALDQTKDGRSDNVHFEISEAKHEDCYIVDDEIDRLRRGCDICEILGMLAVEMIQSKAVHLIKSKS